MGLAILAKLDKEFVPPGEVAGLGKVLGVPSDAKIFLTKNNFRISYILYPNYDFLA